MSRTYQAGLIVVVFGLFASAAASPALAVACDRPRAITDDTRNFGDFVLAEMQEGQKEAEPETEIARLKRYFEKQRERVAAAAAYDGRYFQLDRRSVDYPVLQHLESAGILTPSPEVDVGKMRSGLSGYGQVVPITRCHWLTNLHVVKAIADFRKEPMKKGTQVFGSFGQANSCGSASGFRHSGISGRLAGFNPEALEPKTGEVLNQFDWAIIATDSPISNLPFAPLDSGPVAGGDRVVLTGAPVTKLDESGFLALGANIAVVERNWMVMRLSDKRDYPGRSGGGIYRLGKRGLRLAGIYIGPGAGLGILQIFDQLTEAEPSLLQDMKRVHKGGACMALTE